MSQNAIPVFNALIRTHHITSRKKVAKLVKAADKYACYVLLRSGGSPGIMYCEGNEEGVRSWVSTVQKLRYKDYQLVGRPNALVLETMDAKERPIRGHLHEVAAVKEFGAKMESLGIWEWWRHAMGYTP
ncbi:hypothetical protein BU16DRAFT_467684 [Lophium mytilinum]|uniref:Uncharacterized protein n=1 Tax=Lophium mytilinum TaxID=390894 RepID=A0A6A6QIZ8_9PEZI|nr:hypothetical protein BU16DRAFT_467684 [Lophium mytilinum]